MNDKVYIILVNYTSVEDTIECLESVLKSNYSNFQIFVVDNSPDDRSISHFLNWINNNSYDAIKTNFAHLVFPLAHKPLKYSIVNETEFCNSDKLHENIITIIKAKNNGFAAANNIVLHHLLRHVTNFYFVWILNNDTVIERDTLNNLAGFYQYKGGKIILGSKIRQYHKPAFLQAIAGYYNIWMGKHYHIGDGEKDIGQYDNYKTGKRNYVVGASMFLSKSFLLQVGVMCEDYFLYFEELDWMQAGLKKGFTMDVAHNAIIYHKEGSSIVKSDGEGRDTSLAEYYSIVNRVRFIKKWYPYCLFTVMLGVVFALIKRIVLGKFGLVRKTSIEVFKILFTNRL
jgi:hypothetical protein